MKTSYLLLLFCGVCCLGGSRAQSPSPDAKPVLPPGPLIQKKAPDFACWIIVSKPQGKAADSTASPANATPATSGGVTVTVTKTHDLVHVERLDERHRSWQTWCRGQTQVAIKPDDPHPFLVAPPPNKDVVNPFYFDFSRSDFQGFEWISAQNFAGVKPVMGKNCLVFKDDRNMTGVLASTVAASVTASSPAPSSAAALTAFVDVETRLPVALMNENGVVAYQFQPPPQEMQTLPANVQAVLDKHQLDAQALKRKTPASY